MRRSSRNCARRTGRLLVDGAGAHHYRLQFLEFLANAKGAGDIVALGDASNGQHTLDEVPYELTLDRLYIHGDVKRGPAASHRSQ